MRAPRLEWLSAALVAALLSAHCNTNRSCTINASSYNTSCTKDSDCVAVFSGSFCGHTCACENAAINVSAQAQYEADLSSEGPPECPCPASPAVACDRGACALRTSMTVDAGTD